MAEPRMKLKPPFKASVRFIETREQSHTERSLCPNSCCLVMVEIRLWRVQSIKAGNFFSPARCATTHVGFRSKSVLMWKIRQAQLGVDAINKLHSTISTLL